jgi:hypothetical protein
MRARLSPEDGRARARVTGPQPPPAWHVALLLLLTPAMARLTAACARCRAENNSRQPRKGAEWETGRLLRTPIGHQVLHV